MKFQSIATLALASTTLATIIDQERFNVGENDVIIGNDFQGYEVVNFEENDEQILKTTISTSSTTHKKASSTTAPSSSTTKTHKKSPATSTSSSSKKSKSKTHSITKTNDGMQLDAAGAVIAGPIAIIAGLLL